MRDVNSEAAASLLLFFFEPQQTHIASDSPRTRVAQHCLFHGNRRLI